MLISLFVLLHLQKVAELHLFLSIIKSRIFGKSKKFVFVRIWIPFPASNDNVAWRWTKDLHKNRRCVPEVIEVMRFKWWSRFAGFTITPSAPLSAKAAPFSTKETPTPENAAHGRISNWAMKAFVCQNLRLSFASILLVHLFQPDCCVIIRIRNVSFGVGEFVATNTRVARNRARFTAHGTSTTGRVVSFRNVPLPKHNASLHVLRQNSAPFKIGLECNGGNKGDFIRVGKPPIRKRTTAHQTAPFVAPPSS